MIKEQRKAFVRQGGFTLLEVLVVVGILAVLLILIFPAAQRVIPKAQEVVCMSHLRTLWLGFSPCATDPEGWPQVPKGITIGSPQEQQWWLDYSTNRLGLSRKDWLCPTVEKAARNAKPDEAVPVIHYLPTLFDARQGTPNRWSSMPWFSEMGNVHGRGNLIIRADGAILPSTPMR
jgi:prepilin-type N-terminal cleavage/methylation domain-containing protein